MKILLNKNDLNEALNNVSDIGFVPTMGSLHEGHISLIKRSKKECKKTIVSIFINPKQFNDKNDYKKYPRNRNKDLSILKKLNVDFVFTPKKKDPRILNEYKKILKYKKMIKFVYQNKPLGTGDAILKAKKYIKDKYFLMLLPDDLIIKQNCSKNMIGVHRKYKSSVMASMNVNKKNVTRWGIYKLNKKIDKKNYLIKDVIEKPSVKSAPSNKAVIGRYILPKDIFSELLKQKPGKNGEIHITDAIQSLIDKNYKFIAHNFSGKYLDCGSMNGYIKSSLEISKL